MTRRCQQGGRERLRFLGHSQAIAATGACFQGGRGERADPWEARAWFEKGVSRGSPVCMCCLATMHLDGIGVSVSIREALRLQRMAADLGFPKAVDCVGGMLWNGEGAPADEAEARCWWARAALLGEPNAMFMLGQCLERGLGGPRDVRTAFLWWRKAA